MHYVWNFSRSTLIDITVFHSSVIKTDGSLVSNPQWVIATASMYILHPIFRPKQNMIVHLAMFRDLVYSVSGLKRSPFWCELTSWCKFVDASTPCRRFSYGSLGRRCSRQRCLGSISTQLHDVSRLPRRRRRRRRRKRRISASPWTLHPRVSSSAPRVPRRKAQVMALSGNAKIWLKRR